MKAAAALFLALALALVVPASAQGGTPGNFDYYVLSLSWSPTWCGSSAGRKEPGQCAPGRRYAFVVHGLWPQYDRGWPQYCDTTERWVPAGRIAALRDIMPSKSLVIHEWRKHGTCAGLTQASYFATLRRFFETLRIPARYVAPTDPVIVTPKQLVRDFAATNFGLESDMLSLRCGNARDVARLDELRVCFSRTGAFTPCGSNERHGCSARLLNLPPVR